MNSRHILRSLATVAVAAVLAGCAYQDPFSLPPLDSGASQRGPSTTLYYGYGPYPRYGYGYGTGYYPYGYYPYGYSRYGYSRYGYDPYNPYYYGPGYVTQRYPPPAYLPYPGGPYCRDSNRDGRCDVSRDAPTRNQPPDPEAMERLRDMLNGRAGAVPTTPVPRPSTDPKRPPPPPKVAPPKATPAPVVRAESDSVGRPERPKKKRSAHVDDAER